MTRRRLSDHFVVEEFDCHNGARVPVAALPSLTSLCLHVLEPLRRQYGPIKVTSGFRERAYNRSIGSTDGSFHVYDLRVASGPHLSPGAGVAADVVPARGTPAQWQAWAQAHRLSNPTLRTRGLGGVGRYDRSGFVHLDIGPRRDWVG
jgi:hypothetical protein